MAVHLHVSVSAESSFSIPQLLPLSEILSFLTVGSMAALRPCDIYAQEMISKKYGYPMWEPEPRDEGVPERGDVGYFFLGSFRRLCNVFHPPVAEDGTTPIFPPFEYNGSLNHHVKNALQDKVLSSQSLRSIDIGGGIDLDATASGVPAGVQIEYHCRSTTKSGALVFYTDNVTLDTVVSNTTFPKYMKKHHKTWLRLAENAGIDTAQLDIVLLCGAVTTTNWMVAAIQNMESNQSLCFSGSFFGAGKLGFHWDRSITLHSGIASRSGPIPSADQEDRIAHSASTSPSNIPAEGEENTQYNQCLFLPHYKIKYRAFPLFPVVTQAGAGPHELPDHNKDDDRSSAAAPVDVANKSHPDVELIGPTPIKVQGPVDIVLDYIINNSNADIAIACEADVNSLLVPTGEDLPQWLLIEKPEIQIEDGLGVLSLRAAVQRERRSAIENLGRFCHQGARQTERATPMIPVDGDTFDSRSDNDAAADSWSKDVSKTILGQGCCLLGADLAHRQPKPFDWHHFVLFEQKDDPYSITSISLASCGALVATGSDDKLVRVWNIETAELLQRWQGHDGIVWSVAFSPTGAQVASGSADTVIYLWNPRLSHGTNTPARLQGHGGDIWTLAYNANGTKLASGSVDATVRIWDTETHQSLLTLRGHTMQIMDLAWIADCDHVVAVADTYGLIWNTSTGEQIAEMKGHEGAIWSIAVSHAGDRVVTVSEDYSARIWDTRTGEELVVLHEHTGPIWSVAWSPDDEEVVTGGYDGKVVISDAFTGQRRQIFCQRPSILDSVTYSSNGKFIASGGADGRVKLLNRSDGSMVAEWSGHTDKCKRVVFINGDKDILTASDDGSLRVWSVTDVLRII